MKGVPPGREEATSLEKICCEAREIHRIWALEQKEPRHCLFLLRRSAGAKEGIKPVPTALPLCHVLKAWYPLGNSQRGGPGAPRLAPPSALHPVTQPGFPVLPSWSPLFSPPSFARPRLISVFLHLPRNEKLPRPRGPREHPLPTAIRSRGGDRGRQGSACRAPVTQGGPYRTSHLPVVMNQQQENHTGRG